MAALTASYTAAQAHRSLMACELACQAEEIAHHLAGHPHAEAGRPRELTVDQCALYRIGIHRHLGDLDTVLATARRLHLAQLPTAKRRARAATDTARALLDAGDVTGAFTQLRLAEIAAPLEARRPSVRTLIGQVAELRPDLPGLSNCASCDGCPSGGSQLVAAWSRTASPGRARHHAAACGRAHCAFAGRHGGGAGADRRPPSGRAWCRGRGVASYGPPRALSPADTLSYRW